MSITEIAIKRPLLITVVFVTAILFGFISYSSLKYNLLPKFDANVIAVITVYRGASADEVQSSVTKPMEDAVASIEGVDKIYSSSSEGVSVVTIQLKSNVSTVTAQLDAERRINQIKSKLPGNADDPIVNRFNSEELPVLRISASANMSGPELYDLVDRQIKPIISNVDGVGSVNLIGGNEREIQIQFDNDKLQAYNLSAAQVSQVIATSNVSYPAGNIEDSNTKLALRLDAKFIKVDELRNLIVAQGRTGGRVLLSDVADVTDGQSEVSTINRINGKPGIGIEISKQSDANSVSVSEKTKQKLEDIKKMYASKGLDFNIAIDQSVYTLASADAVMHDLFLAVLIVALVMLLFLHSVRSSLFVLVSLPSAMIPTFILMYLMGFSLNLMTLMALSLVVGILVDDSIVVLENIFRHMEMGKDKLTASIEGRSEIGFTALAITLVDVVVFLPMSVSGGMIGNILREFSLVVVFSTLMSLLVSFTITPLLSSRFAKLEHLTKDTLRGRFFLAFESFLDSLKNFYGRVLYWALSHKKYVLIAILFLFVGTFSLIPAGFIGTAFVKEGDKGELIIALEMAPETPIYQMNQATLKAEQIVMANKEVTKVFANVGTQSGNALIGNTSTSNIAELAVTLVDKDKRSFSSNQFGARMRNEISKIPGIKVTVKLSNITGNAEAPIQIAVKGTDMEKIAKVAAQIKAITQKTAGTDYVEYSTKSPKNEIDIQLDRDKMAMVNLTVPEVGNAVQLAFRGNDQAKFTDDGEEYTINMESDKFDKRDIESVRNITVRNNRGANIRLAEISNIKQTIGQSVLERTDRLNSMKIFAFTSGRPNGTVVADLQKITDTLTLPQGITIAYLGEAERQKDAFGSLGLAMGIGFLLVYLIMVALYESLVYPFVVMFSIPVALIGAFLALALAMDVLSIFAIVGLIMLMGLVAKNGILIVDFANQLKLEGYPLVEALVEAGKERLRPILMTTVAMIFGMLPIALSTGSGAEVKNGMAWVIIGGLSSSLLLTLILVPTMYFIVDAVKDRWSNFSKKRNLDKLMD